MHILKMAFSGHGILCLKIEIIKQLMNKIMRKIMYESTVDFVIFIKAKPFISAPQLPVTPQMLHGVVCINDHLFVRKN